MTMPKDGYPSRDAYHPEKPLPKVGEPLPRGAKGFLVKINENNFRVLFGTGRFEPSHGGSARVSRRTERARREAENSPTDQPRDIQVINVVKGGKPGIYVIDSIGAMRLTVRVEGAVALESEDKPRSRETRRPREGLHVEFFKSMGLDLESAGEFTEIGSFLAENLWSILQRQRSEALDS